MLKDQAKYPPQAVKMIQALAADEDIKALAQEPDIKMTQNHYGSYMQILAMLSKQGPTGDSRVDIHLWADVLIEAGANEQGVRSALKVST